MLAELRSKADELVSLLPADATFTVEDLAGDHAPQLGLLRDRAPWIHVMCARQSGKSWGCDGMLLDNALRAPRSTNVLLGLKGTGVKLNNWVPIWKRLCERYGIPDRAHNETLMLTTFPNESRVMFAGTDDLSNVKKYLGNSLAESVFIIDESQDQGDEVFRYLLRQLLPPMLTKSSRVVLAGVLPDVSAGRFLELSRLDAESGTGGQGLGFSHHEWGRAANVHTPEAMEQLTTYMRDHGITEDDPQIQRDWYMRRVWDPGATAYRYKRRTAYPPNQPQEFHSVGIDPGTRDRMAVVVWGWSARSRDVFQVAEHVWPRNAGATLGDLAKVLGGFRQQFNPSWWFYDAGSSQMTIDTFGRDYGIPVIQAAKKVDLPGQVARFADLLGQGRCHIIAGSQLEEDLLKARWDQDARAKGHYRWSSQWHPDVADAARYGLQGYFDMYQAPEPTLSPLGQAKVDEQARIREAMAMAQADRSGMPSGDALAGVLGFREDWT